MTASSDSAATDDELAADSTEHEEEVRPGVLRKAWWIVRELLAELPWP